MNIVACGNCPLEKDVLAENGSHILTLDVGNSRIKCGLIEDPARAPSSDQLPRCLQSAALAIETERPGDAVLKWIDGVASTATRAVIAGSNPRVVRQIADDWPAAGLPPLLVMEDVDRLPLTVDLPEPQRVGIDRLLTAVAANRLRPANSSAIIVDCGTATTVNLVTAAGAFAGGAILPGFRLSACALNQHTAQLPLIDVASLGRPAPAALGRGTVEAIGSGLFWGQVGAVKELAARLAAEPTASEAILPFILVTGGGGDRLAAYVPLARHEPHLSLQGLALAAAATGDTRREASTKS